MFYSFNLPIRVFLFFLSFLLVAFGQPAWDWWIGLIAAAIGYACFWSLLIDIPQKKSRFFLAMGWYAAVQVVQLSWMFSHPYLYIYGVVLFCSGMMGIQFGLLSLLIQPAWLQRLNRLLAIAALWTVLEWSRLFFFSGLSFNPAGLALTGSIYPLQFASIGGMYLLSFWVILTNLFALRFWLNGFNFKNGISYSCLVLIPYLFGGIHLYIHTKQMEKEASNTLATLLVQTAFPVEEKMHFGTPAEACLYVLSEWKHILSLVHKQVDQQVDLLVLPEYAVPYGTYYAVFPFQYVKAMFKGVFGAKIEEVFPPLEEPYALSIELDEEKQWFVTNAFFAQTLANLFQADVIIGLEDREWTDEKENKDVSYSAAFHFPPNNQLASRYEKRVLVPMGEYIPFEFFRQVAARYGINGSFTCGEQAKVFNGKVPLSPSICYEETYGHMMHEGRVKGAEFIVNLTNDAWYPNSRLPQQHFDHSRLRTVENGVPLARACNTGVTAAVDSLGRIVGKLGDEPWQSQWTAEALYVKVPTYHYPTIYAKFGDTLILGFSGLFLLIGLIDWKRKI